EGAAEQCDREHEHDRERDERCERGEDDHVVAPSGGGGAGETCRVSPSTLSTITSPPLSISESSTSASQTSPRRNTCARGRSGTRATARCPRSPDAPAP